MSTSDKGQEISTVQLVSIIKRKLARRTMRLLSKMPYPELDPTNTTKVKQHYSTFNNSSFNTYNPSVTNHYSYLDGIKTSEEAWRTFQDNKNSTHPYNSFDVFTRPIDTPPSSPPTYSFSAPYTSHYMEYLQKRERDKNNEKYHNRIGSKTCSFIPISQPLSEEQIQVITPSSSRSENRSTPKLCRKSTEKKLRASCDQEINELQQMIIEIKQKVAKIYNPDSTLFRKLSQCERHCSKNTQKRAASTSSYEHNRKRLPKVTVSA